MVVYKIWLYTRSMGSCCLSSLGLDVHRSLHMAGICAGGTWRFTKRVGSVNSIGPFTAQARDDTANLPKIHRQKEAECSGIGVKIDASVNLPDLECLPCISRL